jgi:uncharacterized protein (UPF0303 family)
MHDILKQPRWEEAYLISESLYAAHSGCFPVIIKGTGMIGTLTGSSLAREEDHQLVIQAIREYLDHQN